jgi:hypothetical protein
VLGPINELDDVAGLEVGEFGKEFGFVGLAPILRHIG